MHSSFRGGFILPLFYLGTVVGFALSLRFPQLHPTISMMCMMAAVTVAITKTPISTTVILSILSRTSMVPVILISCIVSFLLTTELSLTKMQRSQSELPSESRIFTSESAPNPFQPKFSE
ncbi:MAG: chloride channel protein [Myxacorys californica WJT36-NPBG1]|nr:chloride channel protein [Myxacorys californica WJT36-NPBG1]